MHQMLLDLSGTDHLSHFKPGFPISPLSCLGREPPEMAIVNLPFFSIDSFCDFMINCAKESTNSSGFAKE